MSSSFGGLSPSESMNRVFSHGPTGASSQTISQARSTTLAQILPSHIKPSRSLRSSSTTIFAPLRRTLQVLFIHLMSGMKCLPIFPLFRRCQFSEGSSIYSFMPTSNPLYTDHQSPNLLKYQVVHLTRSSPAPTISLFFYSRLGLTYLQTY